MKSDLFYASLFCLVLFILPITTFAQTSCGSIIDDTGEATAIIDCDNPLNITGSGYPYNAILADQSVVEGAIISVATDLPVSYKFVRPPRVYDVENIIYKHEGDNYRQVFPSSLTATDIQIFADEFFPTTVDSALYVQKYVSEYISDDVTEDVMVDDDDEDFWDNYNNFVDYVFVAPTPLFLDPGTYTLVSEEIEIFLMQETTLFNKIFAYLIPTAHAQFSSKPRYSATFTIVETPPEPTGASSILFLPGIMGSDLYEEGSFCGLGGEVQLWTSVWPFKNTCKQLRLKTNATGESINDIYTKPEAVVESLLGFNLYKSFVSDLVVWQQEGTIGAYKVVPYDWRLKLNDIMKTKLVDGRLVFDANTHYTESYLYQSLFDLAATTSEVTIVAHSNGGLLAKYFLDYLEKQNDPLLSRVKNLILVAVPQNGTPEAVVSMLHGSGMGPFDTVVTQQTARELVTTSAFGHHLLPSSSYFNSTDIPVITFSPGVATNDFIEKYGTSISTKDDLHSFLSDIDRSTPAVDELGVPSVVDQFLLNYSDEVHTVQSQWQPPETLKVHQVAGTGLYTPITLEYFTNEKCVRRNPLKLFVCVETASSLSYKVILTRTGDETVVDWSAVDGPGQLYWLNLPEANDSLFNVNRIHRDILEVPELRTFVKNIILNTDSSYTYILTTKPAFSEEKKIIAHLHSPLDLTAVHADDTVISSTTPYYLGIEYFRFGEVQTIIIPDELRDLVTLKLNGESFGSFTFDIEEWEGSSQLSSKQFKAVPSATSTLVTVSLAESLDETMLKVDYDGDTEDDVMVGVTDDGEIIYTESSTNSPLPVVDLTSRRSSGSSIRQLPEGQVLGVVDTGTVELERLQKMYDLLVELYRLLVLLETLRK